MRLINADALIDSLNIRSVTYNCIINKCIEDAPTIDAVEVVRCKDCKHLKTMCEDEGTCYYWCKQWNNATDDWGYCYYGERREP